MLNLGNPLIGVAFIKPKAMLKLVGVKSKEAYYISAVEGTFYTYFFVNDKSPVGTFQSGWYKVDEEPKKIHRNIPQPKINKRFELKEVLPSSISKATAKKLRKVWLLDEVGGYDDYELYITNEEFKAIRGLYDFKEDTQEPKEELIEFEYNTIGEVELIEEPQPFKYNVLVDSSWSHKGYAVKDYRGAIKNYLFDSIITPPILAHTIPCKISGDELYDIVRAHIKVNIDPLYAEITSDYAFCLTVKKRIPLAKPYKKIVEYTTGKGRRQKTRFETKIVTHASVIIFEATPPHRKYGKYPVLQGLEANNHDELKIMVDEYLKGVMEYINEPLTQCPSCHGMGVVKPNGEAHTPITHT